MTRKQKLLLYKAGVCPRMNWELVTGDFPISSHLNLLMDLFNPGGDCHEVPQEVVRFGSTG